MIKISVFYPNGPEIHFDMPYYVDRHIKLVPQLLGTALKGVSVDQGVSGEEPGSLPPYIAAGHLLFESIAEFQASFGVHAEKIVGRRSQLHELATRAPDQRSKNVN